MAARSQAGNEIGAGAIDFQAKYEQYSGRFIVLILDRDTSKEVCRVPAYNFLGIAGDYSGIGSIVHEVA